jgi:hypothetical protein
MNVVLVFAALLLAACGDDDGGGATANDQEIADEAIAAVEQALSDDGFTASPDDEDEDFAFQSQECREFDEVAFQVRELPGETARASASFDRGELESTGGGVEETVAVGATFVGEPEDLDPLFELLDDERLGPCLEEGTRIAFGEGAAEGQEAVDVGDVEIGHLESEGLGGGGAGFQGTAEITTSGITFLFSFANQFASPCGAQAAW